MEREVLLTGIGGQGVQLAGQVLGRAAILQGYEAMIFGVYSGAMRGGNTDANVVIADEPVKSPPVVSKGWSAMAMHHRFFFDGYGGPGTGARLAPGALVLVNSSIFEGDLDPERYRVVEVPATTLAIAAGGEMVQSMVMLGAYVAVTGVVPLEAAVAAMHESVPSYRRQHIERNEAALRAGAEHVAGTSVPFWESDSVEVGA